MTKFLLLALTLILWRSAIAMDDYINKVPLDAKGILEYQLYKPARGREAARKATQARGENYVADEKEKHDWFSRVGRPLTPEQIQATKVMIESSECKYVDFDSKETTPPTGRRIAAPGCQNDKTPFVQCEGRVKCTFPGFPLVIGAICFAENGQCPDAKGCALQSAYEMKQDRLHGDDVVFSSMWIGGYHVEK